MIIKDHLSEGGLSLGLSHKNLVSENNHTSSRISDHQKMRKKTSLHLVVPSTLNPARAFILICSLMSEPDEYGYARSTSDYGSDQDI